MDIPVYLKKKGLTQADFARLVGVSQPLVWRWVNKPETVSPRMAKRIEEVTGGLIKRRHLKPELFA